MGLRIANWLAGCAGGVLLVAAGQLYAREDVESWSITGLNGWVADPPAMLSNPEGYLQIGLAKSKVPVPDECLVVAGTNASMGVFAGDYQARGAYVLSFRFSLSNNQIPSGLLLRLKSAVSGWEWSYPLPIPPGGVWTNYMVPLLFSAGWRHGPGDSPQKFADDLRHI